SRARGKGRNESALGQGARCYLGTRSHVRDQVGKQPSLCPSKGPPSDVWGRPGATRRRWNRHRAAPTRVGTTYITIGVPSTVTVHPHARGDDATRPKCIRVAAGTPPRAWGRPGQGPPPIGVYRYTPTRVGTTQPRSTSATAHAVHPHARGDDRDPLAGVGKIGCTASRGSGRRLTSRHG